MNEGVKILLARMETNPEEFIAPLYTGASKWGHLIESYKHSLDVEDQQAIEEGYKKIHQQRFTEQVMKELLAPEEDMSMGKPWYPQPNAMPLVGQIPAMSSITLNTNTVHNGGKVEVNKKPLLKVRKPQQETLVDKLKNYLNSPT
jgi:hypothetical protein